MNPLDCECNCHQLDHADNCSCYCMMGGMSYREMEKKLSEAISLLEKMAAYLVKEIGQDIWDVIPEKECPDWAITYPKPRNNIPVITGDSDTDELLEIERCNQENER